MDLSLTTHELNTDAHDYLARWILRDRLPFAIVASEDFKAFLRRLNPHYRLPCRQTIKRKVMLAHVEERELLMAYFRARPSLRPCCILDLWKSSAGHHYVGIVAAFIDED